MEIRSVGVVLFHGELTDRHDEANSCFYLANVPTNGHHIVNIHPESKLQQ